MIRDRRHVRMLRLRGGDGRAIERGHALVRQALALSSFRGDGLPGRLLIRSLDLPPIDPGGSAEALAGACSRALERAWSDAVPFSAPGAERAAAVRVASEFEPWTELARRACRAAAFDVSGWFWPLLLPGLDERLDRARALDLAITALGAPRQGLPALAATLGLLVDEGIAEPLLEALTPSHARALLAALGLGPALAALGRAPFTAAAPPPVSGALGSDSRRTPPGEAAPEIAVQRSERAAPTSAAASVDAELEPAWRRVLAVFVTRWGVDDPRSAWLCHCALWVRHPSRASGANVARSVRRLLQRAVLSSELEPVSAMSLRSSSASNGTPTGAARQSEDPPSAPGSSAPERATATTASAASGPGALWEAPVPSEFAGLYFIVAILGRLGIEGFLTEHPALTEIDLPCRLLARLAERLEVPLDDVIRRPLDGPREDRRDAQFIVPDAWFGALVEARVSCVRRLRDSPHIWVASAEPGLPVASWQGPLPEGLAPRMPAAEFAPSGEYRAASALDVLLDAWERALSLWLARWTELDCRALVRRPGRVAITRTHVDIFFDLNQADVRVRRAALDINPGYVWYLGRIVSFHYTT